MKELEYFFLHGPEYDDQKPHSGANGLVEKSHLTGTTTTSPANNPVQLLLHRAPRIDERQKRYDDH